MPCSGLPARYPLALLSSVTFRSAKEAAEYGTILLLLGSPFLAVLAALGAVVVVLAVRSALPRQIDFDWDTGRLTLSGPLHRTEIPLTSIRGLELRAVKTRLKRRTVYNARIRADVLDAASGRTWSLPLLALPAGHALAEASAFASKRRARLE